MLENAAHRQSDNTLRTRRQFLQRAAAVLASGTVGAILAACSGSGPAQSLASTTTASTNTASNPAPTGAAPTGSAPTRAGSSAASATRSSQPSRTATTVTGATTAPAAVARGTGQPRQAKIMLTAPELARLRAKKNANDPTWQRLKSRADELVTYSIFPYKFDKRSH